MCQCFDYCWAVLYSIQAVSLIFPLHQEAGLLGGGHLGQLTQIDQSDIPYHMSYAQQ